MIRFDAASVLLQWASGGLLFLWVTTRHPDVGPVYGWFLRGMYASMALGAAYIGIVVIDPLPVRDIASVGVALAATIALVVSVLRERAGAARRAARGFPRPLDVVAPCIGLVGIVAAGLDAGGAAWLTVTRFVVGAMFLGCVSDTMVLVRWHLARPELDRASLVELVRWTQALAIGEIVVWLVPTGMWSVFNGTIDDGYGGLLGWFWIASALTMTALLVMAHSAVREPYHSAVMTTTGLWYLVVLTAAGMYLVASILLSL